MQWDLLKIIIFILIVDLVILIIVLARKKRRNRFSEANESPDVRQYNETVRSLERKYRENDKVRAIGNNVFIDLSRYIDSEDNINRDGEFYLLVGFDGIYVHKKGDAYDFMFCEFNHPESPSYMPQSEIILIDSSTNNRDLGIIATEKLKRYSIYDLDNAASRDALQNVITEIVVNKIKQSEEASLRNRNALIIVTKDDQKIICKKGYHDKNGFHILGYYKKYDHYVYYNKIVYSITSSNYTPMMRL